MNELRRRYLSRLLLPYADLDTSISKQSIMENLLLIPFKSKNRIDDNWFKYVELNRKFIVREYFEPSDRIELFSYPVSILEVLIALCIEIECSITKGHGIMRDVIFHSIIDSFLTHKPWWTGDELQLVSNSIMDRSYKNSLNFYIWGDTVVGEADSLWMIMDRYMWKWLGSNYD